MKRILYFTQLDVLIAMTTKNWCSDSKTFWPDRTAFRFTMNFLIFYSIFALTKAQTTMQCFTCDVTTNVMCDDPGETDCQNAGDQVRHIVGI